MDNIYQKIVLRKFLQNSTELQDENRHEQKMPGMEEKHTLSTRPDNLKWGLFLWSKTINDGKCSKEGKNRIKEAESGIFQEK